MEHTHLFKHTGGGCVMPMAPDFDPKKCCDDDYECACGEKFRVYSSANGHRYLPEKIVSEPMSEVKEAEQTAITDEILKQRGTNL